MHNSNRYSGVLEYLQADIKVIFYIMENTSSSVCFQIEHTERRNESINWVVNDVSSDPTEMIRELSPNSSITSTSTTVLNTKVSVFVETAKTVSLIELDENLNKAQPEEEREFVEEKGGYEDEEQEVSDLEGDDEDGFVEKDEEGGYEDEDEENED